MKKFAFYIIIMLFVGCEKKTEWELEPSTTKQLVVDGIITNELKKHRIKLTYVMQTLQMGTIPASGATVRIEGPVNSFNFIETPAGSGIYISEKPFIAAVRLKYNLVIEIEGKTYTAQTGLVPVTPLSKLTYQEDDVYDSLYRISWVADFFEQENPAMYEINIDWSQLPEFTTKDPDSCKARVFYYALPTIDVSQAFAPNAEKVLFPKGSKIIERKYSLTPKHAEFIRSMLFETRWRGGLFDEAPANVRTNLDNGAMGYFGACAVLELTFDAK